MATARLPATKAAGAPQAGFMLVEAVAALALIGLLLVFVLPSVPSGTSSPRFEALVVSTAALLRDARSEAIGTGVPVAARFDARLRRLRSGGREVVVPTDVAVALTAGGACPTDGLQVTRIVFRADGTNCGSVLRFARGDRILRVRVDWVDGRIDVVKGG